MRPSPRMIVVGGGKGGVGKTFLASNLAVFLALAGRQVVAVDTDFTGANLHTWLGVGPPDVSLADFFSGRERDPSKLLIETPLPNLNLLPATQGHLMNAQQDSKARFELIRSLRDLKVDFVILDCGAGSHPAAIDFFVVADESLVVFHPEPTSIENAYAFLQSALYRKIQLAMLNAKSQDYLEATLKQNTARSIQGPVELVERIRSIDNNDADRCIAEMDSFHPQIVLNEVENEEDVKLGFSIQNVCRNFFHVNADYLGYINVETRIRVTLREGKPLITTYPDIDASIYLKRIGQKILGDQSCQS